MSRSRRNEGACRGLLPLVLVLAAAIPALAAGPVAVVQRNRAFNLKEIEIESGGTVRFDNDDEFVHQIFVQSPAFSFESDEQEPKHAMNVTFPTRGTFDVQCHIHPKMHLRVDVR